MYLYLARPKIQAPKIDWGPRDRKIFSFLNLSALLEMIFILTVVDQVF